MEISKAARLSSFEADDRKAAVSVSVWMWLHAACLVPNWSNETAQVNGDAHKQSQSWMVFHFHHFD